MQFITNNRSLMYLNIMHEKKETVNIRYTKFLGLTLDNTLSWKTHRDTTVPKLSSVYIVIRTIKTFLSQESLRMVHYSYFKFIGTYRLIFWGNSCYSNTIFRLQKKNYYNYGGDQGYSRREYFRELKILSLQSQYIYSFSMFVINSKHLFKVNSEIRNIKRTKSDLHLPPSHLSVYQKGTYYTGIRCSTVYLFQERICLIIQNNLNRL
jgi:hypothetical protein